MICLSASDIIALSAIFIAVMTTLIQAIFERRREWHIACELLFQSMDSMFTEIKELAVKPEKTNHISFQHCLNHRKNLLDHYGKRFILKNEKIKKAREIITNYLVELLLNVEYEELINAGFENKEKQDTYYFNFVNDVRAYAAKASEALIN